MSSRVLVCPFDKDLLSRFHGLALVIRIDAPRKIVEVAHYVRQNNQLHAIMLETKLPLSSIPFDKAWSGIPIALYTPELGDFRELAGWLPLLKNLDIRIFMPAHIQESYTSLRILSSLNLASGLYFSSHAPDWDAMRDLLSYAAYGKIRHAPIEPFQFIISDYRPAKPNGFGSVYFEDPNRYLHISSEGKIALTHEDLVAGRTISCDPNRLDEINSCPEYREYMDSWRAFFLKQTDCACCQGWLVCLGRLYHVSGKSPDTCGKVMAELMDAGDYFRTLKDRKRELWRF